MGDANWIVENINGNVPQGLSGPVTVAYAAPRSRKGGGKGLKGGSGLICYILEFNSTYPREPNIA